MNQRNINKRTWSWFSLKCNRSVNRSEPKTTFQESFRTTLFIGQICSLIPVVGIFSNNVHDVRFALTSWKCIYALLSFLGQSFMTVMGIINVIATEVTLGSVSHVAYNGTACIAIVFFFKIAKSWPKFVQYTAYVEGMDESYDRTLKRKFNVTCAMATIVTFVELMLMFFALLADTSNYYGKYSISERFARCIHSEIFNFIPYLPLLGLITLIFHIQATLINNFLSLFIINMSYYLTLRLKHVNKKLLAVQDQYMPEAFWRDRRQEYERTNRMVKKAVELISAVVFITFANYVFSTCSLLFTTLERGVRDIGENINTDNRNTLFGGYENKAFFSFTLVNLFTRFVAVSLIACEVHAASLEPAVVLYHVPSSAFCVEVQRFLNQVHGDKLALTGLQFFDITHELLLNVLGTIVTYELILYQIIPEYSPEN